MSEEIDTTVKLTVYQMIAGTGLIPTSFYVAQAINLSEATVRAAFARLYAKRLLVPERDDPSRIRMAPPFSGVATSFPVEAKGALLSGELRLGCETLVAVLHADAVIPATDGHSGESLTLEIKDGRPLPQPYFAHFAVPAAHWWDDIVFT